MSWRKRKHTIIMTLKEYEKGFTKKPTTIIRTVGEICKPMEKGTNNSIGCGNHVRITMVVEKQRSNHIYFEKLREGTRV